MKDSDQQPKNISDNNSSIITNHNLALLHKKDRTVVMVIGLVLSMAGTAITFLGKQNPGYIVLFTLITIVLIIALLALLYVRGDKYSGTETRLNAENAAAKAINGNWWQIVREEGHPGLSYISIGVSSIAEKSALTGRTFNEHGKLITTFSSDAIAIRTTSPIEVFYMYTGTIIERNYKHKNGKKKSKNSESQDDFSPLLSGVGRLRFDSVGNEKHPIFGSGLFTKGAENQMKFSSLRSSEMIRFTAEEEKKLNEGNAEIEKLAIEAFNKFNLETGRVLEES